MKYNPDEIIKIIANADGSIGFGRGFLERSFELDVSSENEAVDIAKQLCTKLPAIGYFYSSYELRENITPENQASYKLIIKREPKKTQ